ncbi:hypothetical protein C0Q70_10413 [Pomacea canaliculata]|uniref:Polypeptide N-acetylgalactosaminyltransferase n=1 Tax=Pomacea canaliculata TaxID=400727 RepID=A0A2T7PCJ1_POMCA|nr:hypothetical protein C0Q70_10413 [Pomacea canaliculata]
MGLKPRFRFRGFHLHSFNQYLSDKLSCVRPIQDTRHSTCQRKSYGENLPKASIVICYHNEAFSVLLRTVYSVLNRSPLHLIHEIILIDDFSNLHDLHQNLTVHLEKYLPKVILKRTSERLGLIRARVFGAHLATGEVLIFLDSHCEVNQMWIEPLLARIRESRKNVAVPIMDIINADSFLYEPSSIVKGGFNWGMHYRWDSLPKSYYLHPGAEYYPIESPTMAGGLFAMDRAYFHELGEYDTGMDIWGGENLELSFRIWMCGGRLEIIPCSRVGHIFRSRRPYGGDGFLKNSLRVAHVWMDGYIKYFFQTCPSAVNMDYGNITERQALRKKLNCKSFKWYLDNIYPEQTLPAAVDSNAVIRKKEKEVEIIDVKTRRKGLLKHMGSGLCVQSERSIYDKRSLLTLAVCEPSEDKNQIWYETSNQDLRLANTLCLDVNTTVGPFARLMHCSGSGSQIWTWSTKDNVQMLHNPSSGQCLVAVGTEPGSQLQTTTCSSHRLQHFVLVSF